ncbi:amidohydrolase [Halocatena marina]|uniref:5-methylthioadenosine/S-adenosylhomocysteine deaminase n=1 Tax=Halocatena marina TaxID=2934937 RepID=A0ABD5YS27_9EURY|nr:amidohydrolase [Halocatena marina]
MTTLGITDGNVLHPDMSVSEADVLIDQSTGEIIDVDREIGMSGDEQLDATDSLVIPGLINAHTHLAMTLLRGYADDKPLETWLREDIWPIESELTPEDVRVGTQLGMAEMIRSGTTGFTDMYFYVPEIAAAVEAAGMRARLGHGVVTVGKADAAVEADIEEGLRVARDVADSDRISTAVMPHSLTTVSESSLSEMAARARDIGVPIHTHVNETKDEVEPIVEEQGVRPVEYARSCGLFHSEDYIAHGVHLNTSEIDILAETGAGVVHCPASNMKLASGMAPVQAMLDAGVTVGLGTDGVAANNDLDMFGEMRDAAMVGKIAADDASAVAAPDVVRMATQGSADCVGFESGQIEPGAPADLAVLDLDRPHLTPAHDLVSHLAYAATGADVRHTVCDGRVLMRERELLTIDAATVRAEAATRAADLVARAE